MIELELEVGDALAELSKFKNKKIGLVFFLTNPTIYDDILRKAHKIAKRNGLELVDYLIIPRVAYSFKQYCKKEIISDETIKEAMQTIKSVHIAFLVNGLSLGSIKSYWKLGRRPI